MSLNWKVSSIPNYKELCWVGEGENRSMNPLTHALIFNCIAVGMGKITHDNASEYYARTKIMEAVQGPLVTMGDGTPYKLTFEDIRLHIGLSVNVSFEARKQWAMRVFVGHGDYLYHYGERRKSTEQIDAIENNMDGIDVSITEEHARYFRKDQRRAKEIKS